MTKLNKRVLSALLALVLFVTNFPVVGSAVENSDDSSFSISFGGEIVSAVEFDEHERITVTAENIPGTSCQWQIQIPGTEQWVNIHGQTSDTLVLSRAVVGSLMVDGSAYVRCAAISTGKEIAHTPALHTTVKKQESVFAAPAEPTVGNTEVTTEATEPPAETAEAVTEAAEPVVEAAEAVTEAAEPAVEAADAVTEAAEPAVEAAEAVTEATEPPAETAEAVTEAAEPPAETAEAVTEATEPAVEAATESSVETTEATESQAEPVERSAQAIDEKPVETLVDRIAQLIGPKANAGSDAGSTEASDFVTVTIHYRAVTRDDKFEKTGMDATKKENAVTAESAADPDISRIFKGTNLNITIPCHVMPGYQLVLPSYYGSDTGLTVSGNTLQVNLDAVSEDMDFYVYYKEEEVSYTARYFLQNVYDDLYTEDTTILTDAIQENMKGYPGDDPKEEIIYPQVYGFTALFFQPDTIASDGSTVFEVYYDRNYYLMNFDMDGGFGTAPVYARYGTSFTISPPTKPGHTFDGWTETKRDKNTDGSDTPDEAYISALKACIDDIPETANGRVTRVPFSNLTYTAQWKQAPTFYTVAYWILDDNNTPDDTSDDEKTFLGNRKVGATSGETAKGGNDLTSNLAICGQDHTHGTDCYVNETDLRYMTFVKADAPATVEGDGSTVLNVYYEYKEYTFKFYYAMSSGTGTDTKYYVVGGSSYGFGYNAGIHDKSNEITLLGQYVGNGSWSGNTGSAAEMPVLNERGSQRNYTKGSDSATVNNVNYNYHYISFKARYGDDISDLWPCDVFESVTMKEGSTSWSGSNEAFVSAWNGEYNVEYTLSNTGNQTIKGNYQKVDSQILWRSGDPSDSTVSFLCFWENGAKTNGNWSVPELYVYNIWITCLLDINGDPVNVIDPVTGEVKPQKQVLVKGWDTSQTDDDEYRWFYLDRSYNTCDDSSIGAQTRPSLIGYEELKTLEDNHLRSTYWEVIFLTGATKSNGVYKAGGGTTYNPDSLTVKSGTWEQTQELTPSTTDAQLLCSASYDPNTCNDHTKYREAFYRDFYYYSKVHTLYFWNHDSNLGAGAGVSLSFGTPLQKYGDYANYNYMHGIGNDPYTNEPNESHYPSTLEPNAYYFDGWYTTSDCLEGTEMDWTRTMPDADLTVYAKWAPIKYNTHFYMDYDRYAKGVAYQTVEGIPHGTKMVLPSDFDPIPTFEDEKGNKNSEYRFVGWFYIDDDGTKKAFNPSEMAVRKELHLFAEWTTRSVQEYQVFYAHGQLDKETGKYVSASPAFRMAKETTGYALEATTKTFTAKPKAQLTQFPPGTSSALWLPHTNSHSIVMRAPDDPTEENPNPENPNTYTFYYVMKDNVKYTVKYLDAATGAPLRDAKEYTVKYAVVTETFQYIKDYIPDAFHKRLILSANEEENVITFYYTKDEVIDSGDAGGGTGSVPDTKHARYLVVHHYPAVPNDPDSEAYEYEEQGLGEVGKTVTVPESGREGFEFDAAATKAAYSKQFGETQVNANVQQDTDGKWTVSGVVTTGENNNPLILHLHYKRATYSYTVEHRDWETKNIIKVDETEQTDTFSNAVFESTVSARSKEIVGYDVYAPDENGTQKTLTLKISSHANQNVITFYYIRKKVTIYYRPVCTKKDLTEGFGGVSNPLDHDKTEPDGSQAAAAPGFHFLGWYTDWATETSKQVSTDALLKPTVDTSTGIYEYTYYAVFEPITLTISHIHMEPGDSAVYEVVQGNTVVSRVMLTGEKDSVTLYAIPEGTYTVREVSSWTWTYKDSDTANRPVEVAAEIEAKVSFDYAQRHVSSCWLHSETRKP